MYQETPHNTRDRYDSSYNQATRLPPKLGQLANTRPRGPNFWQQYCHNPENCQGSNNFPNQTQVLQCQRGYN